jgi:hypothetical protein
VPTTWEPPAFLAGQIRGSANVTLGNTVLVGHLGGASGDVFKHLELLQPGDTVVAVSRGLEYTFVVSDKQVRSADDSRPTTPSDTPRLTLMTCTGTWDPLTRNYSERLWITAEPWELASRTIAANAARPLTPVPTPDAAAAASVGAAGEAVGLGAARATLDASLGPPLGETPDKLVVYRKGATEFHVAFTPYPPRAERITLLPVVREVGLSIPTAVQQAHAQFPTDAAPRSQGPDGPPGLIVERFVSTVLANALSDSSRDGEPGDFVAVYARDPSGQVTRVVIAAGDDPDAAMRSIGGG